MELYETMYNFDDETAEIYTMNDGRTMVSIFDRDCEEEGTKYNERRYYTKESVESVVDGMYKHGWIF